MTINDLLCDLCGRFLAGPSGGQGLPIPPRSSPADQPEPALRRGGHGGVRFTYHPGTPRFRDDSGLACEQCWAGVLGRFGDPAHGRCAACGEPVTRTASLHLRRFGDHRSWQLCARDAVEFLNLLRTVEPKLDQATFRFPPPGA